MTPSAAGPARHADQARIGRHALAAYALLAYGLSWAWLIPMALSGDVVQQGSGAPTHFPALLDPCWRPCWSPGGPVISRDFCAA